MYPKTALLIFGLILMLICDARSSVDKQVLKNAIVYLNNEKVGDEMPTFNKIEMDKLGVIKNELGLWLDDSLGSNGDSKVGERIAKFLCSINPSYKQDGTNSISRRGKFDGLLDDITWKTESSKIHNAQYLNVSIRVGLGGACDTFLYIYKRVNSKWYRIFENENPSFKNGFDGRCLYSTGIISGKDGTYVLIVNSFVPATSNVSKLAYGVYKEGANSVLKAYLGPCVKSAIIPDPQTPYSLTCTQEKLELTYISERDSLAKNTWTDIIVSNKKNQVDVSVKRHK